LCVWASELLNAVIFNTSSSHVCDGSEDNSLMKPTLWIGMYWFNSETPQQRFLAVCNFDPLHLNFISWSCSEIMSARNQTDLMQCQIASSWCTSSGHQITNARNEIKIWCCTLLLEARLFHPVWHWACILNTESIITKLFSISQSVHSPVAQLWAFIAFTKTLLNCWTKSHHTKAAPTKNLSLNWANTKQEQQIKCGMVSNTLWPSNSQTLITNSEDHGPD